MICPKCHSENADDAKFCTHCGSLLETSYIGLYGFGFNGSF